jgi:hypothetical protein
MIPLNLWAASSKNHSFKKESLFSKEQYLLEFRAKKEISDKKNSPLSKYTIAILVAREFKSIGNQSKAHDFYKIADEMKIEMNRHELKLNLKNSLQDFDNLYYFDVNLNELIKKKQFEKAILSLNPHSLILPENKKYRVIYDLLQVKVRGQHVKKLYCNNDSLKEIETLNSEVVLCNFVNEYLKDGKRDPQDVKYVEEYYLKNDLNDRYLLTIVRDLQ